MRPRIYNRHSIRLRGYDYTRPGAYFVTMCTANRARIFGRIVNGIMFANDAGRAVEQAWQSLPERFATVAVDAFVVMPDHVHGIVWITASRRHCNDAGNRVPRGRRVALGRIVGAFKSISARAVNGTRGVSGRPVWQRNFYDAIIRSDGGLRRVRAYIHANPAQWGRKVRLRRRRTSSAERGRPLQGSTHRNRPVA